MTERRFLSRLHADIRDYGLLERGAGVMLAVSGGPDSMALLDAMEMIGRRRDTGWRLSAAHFHHGLRGRAAELDAALVRRAVAARGVALFEERGDVRAVARQQGVSVEVAGRRCRYDFLCRAAEAAGARVIAVAHHADDQAETVLHHVLRGTGLSGLAGMPRSRRLGECRLIRPMLGLWRAEILEYVRARRIRYRIDRSNLSPATARNWIRLRLMPLIRRGINPRFGEALVRLAQQAAWAAEMVGEAAEGLLPAQQRPGSDEPAEEVRIAYGGWRAAPAIVQAEAIRRSIERLGGGLLEIGYERLTAAVSALRTGVGGRKVQFPGGVVAERRGAHVVVRRTRTRGATARVADE